MITDEELEQKEAEVDALFGLDAELRPVEPSTADEERIRRILGRIRVEALMKDTVSFIFQSFGVTLSGVAKVLLGAVPGSAEDKPSSDRQPPNGSSEDDHLK